MSRNKASGLFSSKRAEVQIEAIRKILRKSKRGVTPAEIAAKINKTERRTLDYLSHIRDEIYVVKWVENRSNRGKKLPRYLPKDGNNKDAEKWWASGSRGS